MRTTQQGAIQASNKVDLFGDGCTRNELKAVAQKAETQVFREGLAEGREEGRAEMQAELNETCQELNKKDARIAELERLLAEKS